LIYWEEFDNKSIALVAEALSKSYDRKNVDKYLVLLGGEQLEVVKL
jgi:ATP-dependent helicase/nuclease subunit A